MVRIQQNQVMTELITTEPIMSVGNNQMKKIIVALVIGAALGGVLTHLATPEPTRGERMAAYFKQQDKQGGPQALAERFMTKNLNVRPGDIRLTYDFTKTPLTATATASPQGAKCNWKMEQVADEIFPEFGWRVISTSCAPSGSA
jgi:hypothetical protein